MNREDLKLLSRGTSTDMSPGAIARRLDIAAELHDLAKALGEAVYVGKAASSDDCGAVDESAAGGKEEKKGSGLFLLFRLARWSNRCAEHDWVRI